MKKTYITPKSNGYALIEPLSPLCGSRSFEADQSSTADAVWSNRQEMNNGGSSIWGNED